MAGKNMKVIHVVHSGENSAVIKQEVIDIDDEETSILCRVCSKSFANEFALNNHVRMEHMEVYANGDPNEWMEGTQRYVKLAKARKKEYENALVRQKTQELLSTMQPTSLMSLASKDVSYIIIKAEDLPQAMASKKKKIEKVKDKPEKPPRKEKEPPQPITGPFECVQPSSLVADGICHQIFFSCCEYSVHFRDEHTRRRKGIRCQVCEKPLCTDMEGVDSPFPCGVCGEGFLSNKDLTNHINIHHSKLKPFQCSICYKRFTQQGGVAQHMRMHTGDRPFQCTYCNKTFTQKSGLDQHLRIHTKLKPYRCVVCAKTFCQSVHLKQHMRTHTNVAPFQCGICQKRFKQSSHLNYHLKGHHGSMMTEEQKKKYAELVGIIDSDIVEVEIGQQVGEVDSEMGEGEVVDGEVVDGEMDDGEVDDGEMEGEVVDGEVVEENNVEYILSDNGSSWTATITEAVETDS